MIDNIKYYIYTLLHPITKEIRYVGFTSKPDIRLKQHIILRYKDHKTNWIKSMLAIGLQPEMKIIDEVACKDEALELEKSYIRNLKLLGIRLTNSTIGGEAPMIGKKHTEESKILISLANQKEKNHFYGKKHTEESRIKISISKKGTTTCLKGKKLSEKHRLSLMKPKSKPVWNKNKTRFDLTLMEKLLQDGLSQQQVANHFNTNQGTVSKYIKKFNFNLKSTHYA